MSSKNDHISNARTTAALAVKVLRRVRNMQEEYNTADYGVSKANEITQADMVGENEDLTAEQLHAMEAALVAVAGAVTAAQKKAIFAAARGLDA